MFAHSTPVGRNQLTKAKLFSEKLMSSLCKSSLPANTAVCRRAIDSISPRALPQRERIITDPSWLFQSRGLCPTEENSPDEA